MTANIDIQNKLVMPEQAKPVLKAVDHPLKDKEEQLTVQSIDTAAQTKKAEKAKKEADISNVNKTEEPEESEEKKEALGNAVTQLNSYVQSINRNLEFNIDTESGQTVVKVIDTETDELIRQIPDEEALEIAKQLDNSFSSDPKETELLLIRAKA